MGLLMAHLLGDGYLQTQRMARGKARFPKWLLLHGLVYALVMAVFSLLMIQPGQAALPLLILAASHLLIDCIKSLLLWRGTAGAAPEAAPASRGSRLGAFAVPLLDQALHLLVILLVYRYFGLWAYPGALLVAGMAWPHFQQAGVLLLLVLLLCKPVALFVRSLFVLLDFQLETAGENPRAGYVIGMLERLTIALLILSHHLGGVAFVLTAKSLARIKQLENQAFAEKYLVGTLASTLIAMAVTLLAMRFF